MQHRRLGTSALVVSDLCMGTMTFGSHADEKTSLRILDHAYDAGIDFYDTAENYPVPPDPTWAGETERIVGKWLATKDRDSVILATKVAGPSHGWLKASVRAGMTTLDRHNIVRAVEASLSQLDPIQPYAPTVAIIGSQEQLTDGRLAGARASDQGDDLSGVDGQTDSLENVRCAARVGEGDIL